MESLVKIINEELNELLIEQNITDDVADKYFRKLSGEPDEFKNFEKKYASVQSQEDNNEVFNVRNSDNWTIIKNPVDLNSFESAVRGVIISNGDFYLELTSNGTIHNDIISILKEKGIISSLVQKNWGLKIPQESGFLTVQRYKKSLSIAIGESNRLIYSIENYNKYISYYDEFLNKAKIKNPSIYFINRLVGVKFMKNGNPNVLINETIAKMK
jgi:plasmid maintenance system antidote protein VapI